ncbi:MAG: hypothetical protein H6730_02975 [Deltaproteobacteria bacterium]|nr:hypothetical protein [Deltaproteobacteria bacterium]
METESHATFEQIEALYLGRLGGRNGEQVRAHLRRCGQCDAAYERLAGLDAALYHAGEDLSPASLQRVGARLFDAPPPAPAPARWPSRVAGLAAAAGLAVTLFAVVPRGQGDFRARGGEVAVSPEVGLRALRVRGGPGGALDISDATQAGLQSSDRLKLMYTNGAAYTRLSVYAVGSSVQALATDVALEAGVDRKVPGTFSVEALPPGTTRLVAVFHRGAAPPPAPDAVSEDGPERATRVLPLVVEGAAQ